MRCFVALWPDDATRDRLDELTRDWHRRVPAARRMRRDNLHLTLAFIGELDAERVHRVALRIAARSWPHVVWQVNRIGAFDRARVLWAGSGDVPELAAIATNVRTLLDELKVRYDRKPFAPHVTLLRNLPRAALAISEPVAAPIAWATERPVLLQSRQSADGVRYVAVEPDAVSAPSVRDTGR